MCVCVCVCVRERENTKKGEKFLTRIGAAHDPPLREGHLVVAHNGVVARAVRRLSVPLSIRVGMWWTRLTMPA